MPHQIQYLFEIYEDILIYPLLDQPHRVKQLILEQKASLRVHCASRACWSYDPLKGSRPPRTLG